MGKESKTPKKGGARDVKPRYVKLRPLRPGQSIKTLINLNTQLLHLIFKHEGVENVIASVTAQDNPMLQIVITAGFSAPEVSVYVSIVENPFKKTASIKK